MTSHKHTSSILSLIILVLSLTQTTKAKSVYVINNTYNSQLQAYKIEDTNLVWQTNYVCESDPSGGTGAVGLAIDESEYGDFLFITFENQNTIEIVNAKTMEYVDTVKATGASNIAGIAVNATQKGLN